jgi:hypothetical protein
MTTIYKSLRGSHAQGVSTPTSDKDFFEIVLPPVEAVLGLDNMIGSQHIIDGNDTRVITLKEFLREAIRGRSTELEVLFAKPEHQIDVSFDGLLLLANRHRLISKRLFKGLLGFFDGQQHRMRKGNGGRLNPTIGYDPKLGAHGIRAIWQAVNLKKTGRLDIFVHDEPTAKLILATKNSEIPLDKLLESYTMYEAEFHSLSEDKVPENPDYDWASEFLIRVYRETYCS